jgi:concentrative nucleoside transporter, CNT family
MTGRLISILGIVVIIGLALLVSTNRKAINRRIVLSAFALQVVIAALVLYVPAGRSAILAISHGVEAVINYSQAGITMVFGPLADTSQGISFAVHVLPVVIFFAALMSILYHLGIMQWVVRIVGGGLRWIIGTHTVESLCAAATIFVGQTESPLAIRPYLRKLSDPQVFTVMATGMASVAGTVLAAYAQLGIKLEYLLPASFMAAPGGLLMAKLIFPDDPNEPKHAREDVMVRDDSSRHANVIMAAGVGAFDGVKLAVAIGAMLVAFVGLIALFNGIVGGIGGWFGVEGITLEKMLGYVFGPLMWLLSVPWSEAQIAGAFFGEKLILNEFVAYLHFGQIVDTLSPRAEAITTFALCGFANLSSIAIQMGALGSLVPELREFIARYGLRAVAAGSLSNLLSAALAGLLLDV